MKRFTLITLFLGCTLGPATAGESPPWRFVSMPDFLNVDTDYPQAGWEEALGTILHSVKAEQPDFLIVPDMVPSGKPLWQPGRNRPLEQVAITPEMKQRGFAPVGKLTIRSGTGPRRFENPQGYFLKKFETSSERGPPDFRKNRSDRKDLPRIHLDGSVTGP